MSESPIDTPDKHQKITDAVHAIMDISQITWGTTEQKFLVRYRGTLNKESIAAYEEIEGTLKPLGFTPLFRNEEGEHTILILSGIIDPTPNKPIVNLILFLTTLFSVIFAGFLYAYHEPLEPGFFNLMSVFFSNVGIGIPFAISMLSILLAHEFGHYLAARYHKTAVTLPFFIPFPLSPLGTMGAFIQLKSPPKNKRVLHDIGVAGPLAGLIVTIPILLYGLSLSTVAPLPTDVGFSIEGNSIFYLFAKYLVHGELLPQPISYGGLHPALYWVRYLLTGYPVPLGGYDVMIHPIAWAGWAGLLVTGLNLIPAGQLDGGHMLYVLFGKKAGKAIPVILVGLALLGFAWQGWWLWAFIIFMMGRAHAEPLDQITKLDPTRKRIAIITLILFFLIFIPVPLQLIVP